MNTASTAGLSLVKSRQGALSLQMIGRDGSSKALHSLYDPEKEARALVDRCSFEGEGQIIVLGLGLGYHVLELARRFPDTELIVVEAVEEIYELARECVNVEAVSERTTFFVGLSPDEALRRITRLQLNAGMRPISIFPFSAAVSAFAEYYEPILTALTKATAVKLWDKLKYTKFGKERVGVLLIDFDYFLTRELERAVESTGHQVAKVRIQKGENGEVIVSKLMERILAFRPDFLLTVNHLGFDQDGVLTSFLESIEMPVASWYVDSPNLIVKEFRANVSPYTTVFLWDNGYIPEVEAMGFESVSYLPLATDERVFRPLHHKRKERVVSTCEVGFVGHSMVEPFAKRMTRVASELHPIVEELADLSIRSRASFDAHLARIDRKARAGIESLDATARIDLEAAVLWKTTQRYRLQCIEKLLDFGLRIHGDAGWKELLDKPDMLGPVLGYYDQLPLFYNLCKINFNATNLQMGTAVNQRVFDVPACQAFLLTDRQEALDELFDVGKEIIAFTDVEEIPDLADYYLRHPEARKAIAKRGRKRVLREHTYRHRLNQIVRVMKAKHGCG